MTVYRKYPHLFRYLTLSVSLVGGATLSAHEDSAKPGKKGPKSMVTEKKVHYICPMHPEVHSDKPGKCPICGMNLTEVPVKHDAHMKGNKKE